MTGIYGTNHPLDIELEKLATELLIQPEPSRWNLRGQWGLFRKCVRVVKLRMQVLQMIHGKN